MFNVLSGFIFVYTPINKTAIHIISNPLTIPYAIPPTSLNCFSIGSFAIPSIKDTTILNIILTTTNNIIAVNAYTTPFAIFSASPGKISFFTWFVTWFVICVDISFVFSFSSL